MSGQPERIEVRNEGERDTRPARSTRAVDDAHTLAKAARIVRAALARSHQEDADKGE